MFPRALMQSMLGPIGLLCMMPIGLVGSLLVRSPYAWLRLLAMQI